MKTKMTIVVRKDLNMRKGKIAAQTGHAVMKVFFDRLQFVSDTEARITNITPEMKEWMQGIFTKIVVGCMSEAEILDVAKKCQEANIPYAVITDCGATEFHGVPTVTCISVGPDSAEKIDPITGGFPLL